jgi:predicted PhzF superfamily epimerase YddE/YHI9
MTRVFLVDAFTAQAFGGNPAAVFLLDDSPSDHWLLAMTREFGCEAAFLSPTSQKANFGLRFFTSSGEDLFCGHGTLSSAHVLYEQGLVAPDARITFDTVSGPFSARRITTGIELDLPAEVALPVPPPAELLNGLGQTDYTVRFVGKNRMDYLVRLESEREVRALRPNFEVLKQVDCRGVIVTAQADPNQPYAVVSRFLPPQVALSRTTLQARRIAHWPRTGPNSWESLRCWHIRLHRVGQPSRWKWHNPGSSCAVRP